MTTSHSDEDKATELDEQMMPYVSKLTLLMHYAELTVLKSLGAAESAFVRRHAYGAAFGAACIEQGLDVEEACEGIRMFYEISKEIAKEEPETIDGPVVTDA